MDPISLAVGAGITMVSFIAGRVTKRKTAKDTTSKPICTCKHGLHDHDPKTNECHGLIDGDPLCYDSLGYGTEYSKIQCTCRQYTGPQRLNEFWTPEILPPSV